MKTAVIILFYFIGILYSVESLSFFFIQNNKSFNNSKFESLDKRNNIEAFVEEKKTYNIHPKFRLSAIEELKYYNDDFKIFLDEKILKGKKIPFRGPINKASLGSNEIGSRKIIINDKYGFKNFNNVYEKSIDLMIIGDSFAEGVPFGNKDDVSGVINSSSNYNSINYGINGAGPLNTLGVLREYGKGFKPKNVFYFYYEGNDLFNLQQEKKTFLIKYLDNNFSQNLFYSKNEVESFFYEYEDLFYKNLPFLLEQEKKQKDTINIIKKKNNFKENLKDIIELQSLRDILIPKSAYYLRNNELVDYKIFEEILIKMKQEVDGWGGKFTLVYLPDWTRYNSKFSMSKKIMKDKVEKISVKNTINFIDMVTIFKKNKLNNKSLFNGSVYGHYTKQGYKILADTIIVN